MKVQINGREREFELAEGSSLGELIAGLQLKGDRIAVEHNGSIVARPAWETTTVHSGDKLEIVHFVGGGLL